VLQVLEKRYLTVLLRLAAIDESDLQIVIRSETRQASAGMRGYFDVHIRTLRA
jgi:hypothetical protein